MTAIEREIASQPDVWAQAADAGAAADLFGDGRVAVIGCGTSYHVALALAGLRGGETDAFPASEAPLGRGRTTAWWPSRAPPPPPRSSTRSPARRGRRAGGRRRRARPRGRAGRPTGSSRWASPTSRRWCRPASPPASWRSRARALGEDLAPAVADARRAAGRARCRSTRRRSSAHVPRPPAGGSGSALEAALKLREAAQAWCEAYPAMEYRHGPIALAGPRARGLARRRAAATAWPSEVRGDRRTVVESDLDPLAQLVQAQRAAVALAKARGLDPDQPRHLTRSVVAGVSGPRDAARAAPADDAPTAGWRRWPSTSARRCARCCGPPASSRTTRPCAASRRPSPGRSRPVAPALLVDPQWGLPAVAGDPAVDARLPLMVGVEESGTVPWEGGRRSLALAGWSPAQARAAGACAAKLLVYVRPDHAPSRAHAEALMASVRRRLPGGGRPVRARDPAVPARR